MNRPWLNDPACKECPYWTSDGSGCKGFLGDCPKLDPEPNTHLKVRLYLELDDLTLVGIQLGDVTDVLVTITQRGVGVVGLYRGDLATFLELCS